MRTNWNGLTGAPTRARSSHDRDHRCFRSSKMTRPEPAFFYTFSEGFLKDYCYKELFCREGTADGCPCTHTSSCTDYSLRDSTCSEDHIHIPLSPKPVIITSAIKNIIHIYIIVSYLINNQIPLRYKHFVIKIMWKPFILYKRIPVRHCLKRPESFHDLILLFFRSVFVYSGQK